MKIGIIGTGYVGLVTGASLANLGNDVICVDIDEKKIEKLRSGQVPFFEPGLRDIVDINQKQRRLMFTSDMELVVENSDVIFIAVGTPSDAEGRANLSAVYSVAESIGKFMNKSKIIIMKSTVPVGTVNKIKQIIKNNLKENIEFSVASNPEFLREGEAVNDFANPDRVVIGVEDQKGEDALLEIYRSVERTGKPILVTDIPTAEIIKYASNAMLATRVSFMNEIASLCSAVGADVKMVSKGIGLDSRIGPRFLQAGIGYGGSCFPKDIKALIQTLKEHGEPANLLSAVEEVNERQRYKIVEEAKKILGNVKDKQVAIWGLSFKPKTDDMREAPSVTIIEELQKLGAKISAFDPVSEENARKLLKDIEYADTPLKAVERADLLIVVTEWDLFRELDKERIKSLMKSPNILDGRNIYVPKKMKELGFNYRGIGR